MEPENAIKGGARHSAKDQQLVQEIHDRALELGAVSPQGEPRAGYVPVKTEEGDDDTLVTYGSAVKALGDGKVGGYLVRFTPSGDYDLTADRFDAVKSDLGEANKLPVLYHHGLDTTLKRRRIGTGTTNKDDVGLWIESQLSLRDAYEKAIYELAEKGKLSWSSGAASHAVERQPDGKGAVITQWFISEASLTPTPAEPRNLAMSIKSLEPISLALPEAAPEDGGVVVSESETATPHVGDAAHAAPTETRAEKSAPDSAAQTATREVVSQGDYEMTPEEKQELLDAMKTITADATALAVKTNKEQIDAAIAGLNAQPIITAAPGTKTNAAPAHNKTPRGDDAFKAFAWFLQNGDASGIRTGEAYENYMKTDYHLVEGTQYQGQEAVPTEVYAGIVQKRDPLSVMRAGNALVVNAKSNAMVIPIEKASPQAWGIVSVDGSNSFTTLTQQPIDKLAATLYLFTYNLPFDIQLIDDATFNIEGWGAQYVGRGLAITENTYLLMGTGSGQPQGAVYAGTSGVTAAAAAAVTAAEVVDLYYKLPTEYQDNVIWAMATATHGAVRKLTVSTQFPFVGNGGANGGVGSSIPGGAGWLVDERSRVFTSGAMDALAASKKPISVMNPSAGYAIVDRKGLTVLRDPYSEAGKGIVNVWFYARFSGGVVNATAIQNLVTPSA